MPIRSVVVVALVLASVACVRNEAASEQPSAPAPKPSASATQTGAELEGPGASTRWVIDGTTIAADPTLPLALDRALRESGRASEDVQDHILADLNGDSVLDAVVLLPSATVTAVYDHLILLSDGDGARVHAVAELVPGASFSAAVVPLVDGPTLIAVAPRLGGCERGPEWTFLRPTGAFLESVGSVRIDGYDCATADASVEFERLTDGRVAAVLARHGDVLTRYEWDAAGGSFVVVEP